MSNYRKIPNPEKIILTKDSHIFYTDSQGNLRVLNLNNLGKDQTTDYILNNIDKVYIWGSAFCWDINDADDDQICLGKDTIWQYSRNVNFKELVMLVSLLKQSKKLSLRRLRKAVAQVM